MEFNKAIESYTFSLNNIENILPQGVFPVQRSIQAISAGIFTSLKLAYPTMDIMIAKILTNVQRDEQGFIKSLFTFPSEKFDALFQAFLNGESYFGLGKNRVREIEKAAPHEFGF